MGAEAIQVHPTPPGFWGSPKLDETRIATFKEAAVKHGHPPFYFHAVYLINLAGDDPTLRQRSESTLAGYLKAADDLGVDGVIFHTGSHKGAGFEARLPSITEHLQHVLDRAQPKTARLLIENNAGLGGCVGARFEEIRQMLDALDDPRVTVCFDTCHAFASGYDGAGFRSVFEADMPGPRKGLLALLTGKPFRLGDVPPLNCFHGASHSAVCAPEVYV